MQRGLYNTVTDIPILIPCPYAERDGMVNLSEPNATLQITLACLHPVRVLRDVDLDKNSQKSRKFWGTLPPPDQERLLTLIALRQAWEGNDRLSVEKRQQAYLRIMPELLSAMPKMPDSKRRDFHAVMARVFSQREKSPNVLERILTHHLRKARLILWRAEKEKRLLPAIYCPDNATALYVRALVGIARGNALLVCAHCGNPFLQQRSDQDYCSIRCREAHRVARWRAAKRRGNRARKRR